MNDPTTWRGLPIDERGYPIELRERLNKAIAKAWEEIWGDDFDPTDYEQVEEMKTVQAVADALLLDAPPTLKERNDEIEALNYRIVSLEVENQRLRAAAPPVPLSDPNGDLISRKEMIRLLNAEPRYNDSFVTIAGVNTVLKAIPASRAAAPEPPTLESQN